MPHFRILLLVLGTLLTNAQTVSEHTFDDGNGLKTWTVETPAPRDYSHTKNQEFALHQKANFPPPKTAAF
ncbi:hypothetical protein N9F70_01335 [bacterium]|nr:hypothetical protein [bacterium]